MSMNAKRLGLVAMVLLTAGPAFANACNGGADGVGALVLGLMGMTIGATCGLVLLGCFVIGTTCRAPGRGREVTLWLSLSAALCGAPLAANTDTSPAAFLGLLVLLVLTTIAAAVAALRQFHHSTSQALS